MDVEQKREVASEFDLHPETMKMSESGYEMMMQKMELDTSDSPESSEVEKETVHHELPEDPQPAKSKPWLIVAVVVSAFIILLFLLLIAGVFLYMR